MPECINKYYNGGEAFYGTNDVTLRQTTKSRISGLNGFCPYCDSENRFIEPTFNILSTMEAKEQVLDAMRKAGVPLNAGKVAELTGLDRKVVDKAFAELKKEGAIVSPVRCKWEPAK